MSRGTLLTQPLRCLHTVHVRHPQGHQNDIGIARCGCSDGSSAVLGGGHDFDPAEKAEHGLETLADHPLIIRYDDADGLGAHAGSSTSTLNPSPAGPAVTRPPTSWARSRMELRP